MDDAQLHLGVGIDGFNGLRKTCKPVHAGN
jgi:hypothetical protein